MAKDSVREYNLVCSIFKKENALIAGKIDSFNVPTRRRNARKAHAGTPYLSQANVEQLQAYCDYLDTKIKEGKG